MDFLKELFGDATLTFDQLVEAVNAHNSTNKDNKITLANLATGDYVSKAKYDAKKGELETANTTIKDLNDTVKKFDGVDVTALTTASKTLKEDYETKIKDMQEGFAKQTAVNKWFDEHPTKHKELIASQFDLSKLTVDKEGKVTGLEETGNTLLEKHKDLFTPAVAGVTPPNPDTSGLPKNASYESLVQNADNMSAEEIAQQFMNMKE